MIFLAAAAPAQFSPANGEVRAGTTVTFTWPAAGGAARYAVQVDFTAGALGVGSPFQATTVGAETTVNVIGLPNDGSELFWRVVPSDSFGDDLPPLATQNFINGSAFTLASPIPYKPADGAVVPIGAINSLGWNFVNRANSYIVQVDTDMGFPSPTETTVFGTYAAGPPASLANSGIQFFWKVRAVYTPPNPMAPVEMSDFSAVQRFTVGQPTGADIEVIPASMQFSVVSTRATDQASVEIVNRGDQDLNITSATQRSGADWITGFSFFAADGTTPISLPRVLPVNQRIRMRVSIDSAGLSPGSFLGFIDLASNDPDENPFTVEVELLVTAASPPATCSPADMPPFGNNDGFVSTSEADAYALAFINGQHNDLAGVTKANQIAADGGFCPGLGGGPHCSDIKVAPNQGTVCVDTTDLPKTAFTFTVSKIPSASGASAKLIRLPGGNGKVEVRKMTDMSVVLGADDDEGTDVAADLAAAAVTFVVEGVKAGGVVLQLELVTTAGPDTVNCPPRAANQISLTVVAIDVDVDSDNSNSTPDFGPNRNVAEESLENDSGSTGRIIALNDDDDDGDLVVDLGDAFNLDCSDGSCVLASTTYNVSGVLAGDITEISLAGRGFTNFFSAAPIDTENTIIIAVDNFAQILNQTGKFYFHPRQGPGFYSINTLRALCGTKQVALTVNISVADGYSAFAFDPGVNSIDVGQFSFSPGVYRLEHRLGYFGFPRFNGVTQEPIVQGGVWTEADSTSFRLFSAVGLYKQFPPAGYSPKVINATLFAHWLSATNAPRWKDSNAIDAAHRHPAFISALNQFTSWSVDLIEKAVELRPQLIRNSPGAPSGKIALFRGSGRYKSFNITDCGMNFSWTWDPASLLPGAGEPGTFPTIGQQALIDDIVAFRDANAALNTSLGGNFAAKASMIVLESSSLSSPIVQRRTEVIANLAMKGIPVTASTSGSTPLINFTLRAPQPGPPKPPQAPPIN